MSQYQHALIAIDLYEPYTNYLERALALAKQYASKISISYTIPYITQAAPYAINIQENMHQDATQRLEALKATVKDETITYAMLNGDAKRETTEYAKENDIDLILVGSHGKHGIDLLLGSTANGIIHLSPCDVLTIRLDFSGTLLHRTVSYQSILLATDFANDNQPIIQKAEQMSKANKARLSAVNVVPDAAMLSIAYLPNIEVDIQHKAKQKMTELQQQLGLEDAQTTVSIGQPKHEILAAAKLHQADLIVIGSHSRGALSSLLLGSTANAVLHGADCDVLVVRI